MDYKSFEYIRKTLPNEFNWSILYQLFKEDEIELSETAENYLRTTPWNTNLAIFEEILEAAEGGENLVLYDGNVSLFYESMAPYASGTIPVTTSERPAYLEVIINNERTILPYIGNDKYGENDGSKFVIDTYPCGIKIEEDFDDIFVAYGYATGTFPIKISMIYKDA